jgi:hypothetical protein
VDVVDLVGVQPMTYTSSVLGQNMTDQMCDSILDGTLDRSVSEGVVPVSIFVDGGSSIFS